MEDRLTWYVSWLAYPLVMLAALALHTVIGASLDSPALSANLPVVLGALLVTLLEIRFPKHRRWRPGMSEVRNDIAYMVIVQMILPRIVVFLLILALVQPIQSVWTVLPGLWPHEAPLWLQAVLMILAADFLRYWLHVAAHRNRYLWRLHAVHHSPHRLYWLNVGRFHPLEKILQMFLDTLPFILLGVGEPVIAMYFVFYAVNGFFQHSNIELRYGLLNYVISGAELHRWHHSRLPEESNRNYGNNLIVWDLLFGTWFLPRDREVDALGLKNRGYPLQISDQLKTPFTPDIAEREVPLQGFGRLGFRMLMWLRMQAVFLLHVLPWLIRAGHPRKAQMKLLEKIVAGNRKTRFGQEHGFGQIRSHADYMQQVPIQDYETMRHWIASQEEGVAALTRKSPVMYALTSGTSAEPKLLPVTRPAMRCFRLYLAAPYIPGACGIWSCTRYGICSGIR
jgi:sterol desaturase/sphingolipid hydroxylase (fatty acid hydroxylase superfamily)